MNKKVFTLGILAIFFSFGFISAENYSLDIYAEEGSFGKLPDFTKWYYFSFNEKDTLGSGAFTVENGSEVVDEGWSSRKDWDIAFHATDIRTNGALAYRVADTTSVTSLEEIYSNLTVAPQGAYMADGDTTGTFIADMSGMPPVLTRTMSVCKPAHGWAVYGMNVSATNSMVLVFKLANGKTYKMYLEQFYDAEGNPGKIEFQYAEIESGSTGLNNIASDTELSIYPNPATEILNVELAESVNNTSVVIYSMTGKIVKQVNANPGMTQIAISDLSAGAYFVRANDKVMKFIVK